MSRTNKGIGTLLLVSAVALATAGQLQEQLIAAFDTAAPAVVHITVRGTAENLFMQPVPVEGSGSGFLYDASGNIVTNYHVIEGAESITVAFGNVDCCEARVVGIDPSTDLAVIQVARRDLPEPLRLADSDELRVGQFVVAIGNPFGLDQTMTFGIISALERVIQSPDGRFVGEAIQTDASVNPGNSGGPLLDLEGRVVGVTSQIISPSRASAGIGFAISSNTVARVVPSLIDTGRYPHPYLGFSGIGLTADVVQLFREQGATPPLDRGVLITQIAKDGPAQAAGLLPGTELVNVGGFEIPTGGDIVLAIDDMAVDSMMEIVFVLDTTTVVGDTVEITIVRNGTTLRVPVVLGERPDAN